MSFFDFWTEAIAIDLGTANTLIIHNDKVVVDSPSIVAIDQKSGKIIAVGKEANMMHGKTHKNIETVRPLKDGVIADFNASEQMIGQLISSGTGQTSRIDALNQAIKKAKKFKFDLNNCVMASDAFFPFPDCVEIAAKEGIRSIIQPGGSIKDNLSIDYCNENDISMVFTGNRHFKH